MNKKKLNKEIRDIKHRISLQESDILWAKKFSFNKDPNAEIEQRTKIINEYKEKLKQLENSNLH